jgi:hypothetical protein
MVAKILFEGLAQNTDIQAPQLDDEVSGKINQYIKELENE